MRSRHRKHFGVRQEVIKANPSVRRKGILPDPPPPPSPVLIDLMISLYYHADNDNTA